MAMEGISGCSAGVADWSGRDVVRRRFPDYTIIIHDDDDHTFPYVMDVLQQVCGHPEETAYRLTHRIHFAGRACVWQGPLEVAELKCEQIREFQSGRLRNIPSAPLAVSIEPVE